MITKKGIWLLVFFTIFQLPNGLESECTSQAIQQVGAGSKPAIFQEELLYEIPPGAEDLGMSPNGRQVVWRTKKDKKWVMVVNGEPGPEFDGIGGAYAFSPDSQHFAYIARRGKSAQVLLDGKEYGNVYSAYTPGGAPQELTFSADSQHLAYFAGSGKKYRLVLDGQEQGPESKLGSMSVPVLSPDGRRWAYWALQSVLYNFYMVTDGGQTAHEAIMGVDGKILYGSQPRFSPDGKHFAYIAARSKGGLRKHKEYLVIDGQEYKEFDGGVSNLVFSPDSQHLAYTAVDSELTSNKASVIVDGKPGPGFEWIVAAPIFSPDSQHVGYIAINKEGVSAQVIDDQVTYANITYMYSGKVSADYRELRFSPDGHRLAYVVDCPGELIKGGHSLFLDAKQHWHGAYFRDLGTPVFSPSGRFLAVPVRRIITVQENIKRWSMIINEREGKLFDMIWIKTLTFSADERQATYVAKEGNKLYLVTQTVE